MPGERLGKPLLFFDQRFLEADYAVEFVLPHPRAARINLPSIFVLLAPTTRDVVVLQGETERVEPGMTTGTIRVFAMLGELLADR